MLLNPLYYDINSCFLVLLGSLMAKERKSLIDIQWITVSYRSAIIFTSVVVLIFAVICYKYFYLSPQTSSGSEIAKAERKLAEAQPYISGPQIKSDFTEAALKLQDARVFFEKRKFNEAKTSALKSYEISAKIIEDATKGESPGNIKFTRLEGTVKVKKAGTFSWVDAKMDTPLGEGDKIKAHSGGSAEFLSFTGDTVTIKPGVLCEIRKSEKNPKTDDENIEIFVNDGFLDLQSSERRTSNSEFKVITPTSEVRVKNKAELTIRASEEETSIKVASGVSGAVSVSSGTSEVKLEANEAVTTTKAGIGDKSDLPGPPVLLLPAGSHPFFFDDPKEGVVTLKWEARPDAKSYRLQVSESRLFATFKVDQEVSGDQVTKGVNLKGLPNGNYFWKVSVKDKNNEESPFSEIKSFRITARQNVKGTPPKLKITETQKIGRFIIIKGESDPGIYLTMNGNRVDVYEDGTFNNIYKLEHVGQNNIEIIATDNYGLSSTEVVTTFHNE